MPLVQNIVIRLFLVLSISFTTVALAKETDGVTLPDTITSTTETSLILNGMGTRKATIFGFKVYVAGLYLTQKSTDPMSILTSEGEKQIHMAFTRDINGADIRDAWESGFENNNQDAAAYKTDLDGLLASTQDTTEGQSIVFITNSSGVLVRYANGSTFESKNPAFGNALLRIWLGNNPPNKELKEGLLGL